MEKDKDKESNKDEINETNQSENLEEISEENISDTKIQDEEENEDLIEEDVKGTEEEKLKEEIKTLKEEKIRVLAEMENLRKRFEREKIDSIKYGSVNFARDILSPGDNLERALSASTNPDFLLGGKSTCVGSPVITALELKPSLVRNISICSPVVF